jgi:hypothetical protein
MSMNNCDIPAEGQHELAVGVLKQASQDLRRFYSRNGKVERELYFDAYSWVMSDDYSWPFSFLNVCRLLNRSADQLRQELLGDLSLGWFRQWARRCQRTIRQYWVLPAEPVTTEYDLSASVATQVQPPAIS